MKITRNTTVYQSADLHRIVTQVHNHLKRMEGRPAPSWRKLRIEVITTRQNRGCSGKAYYNAAAPAGQPHVTLRVPCPIRHQRYTNEREFGWLVYHELMHTYGYRHRQFNNIPTHEAALLFPDNQLLLLDADRAVKVQDKLDRERARKREQRSGKLPITIRLSKKAVEEFHGAEYGLYEDTLGMREDGDPNAPAVTVVEIIERSPGSGIRIETREELEHAIWAAQSGVWGQYCPRACNRFIAEAERVLSAIEQREVTHDQ